MESVDREYGQKEEHGTDVCIYEEFERYTVLIFSAVLRDDELYRNKYNFPENIEE